MVREAFRARGHDAWSADLLPASDSSLYHFQGDALEIIAGDEWDLVIAHPPCTYLTNSAAWAFKEPDFTRYPCAGFHQKLKPGTLTGAARQEARVKAAAFALGIWHSRAPRVCIENPVGYLSRVLGKTPVLQPYQFGDDASKGTALWLRGLPPLTINPKAYFPPRLVCDDCAHTFTYGQRKCPNCGSHAYKPRWGNQTDGGQNKLSPGDDRAHLRAITYPGIANAMAEQWSKPTKPDQLSLL